MAAPMIEISNLRKEYRSRAGLSVVALDSISFDVFENEFVSLVGPSGCGKSTILKLLSGLTQKTSGSILVNGKNVARPGEEHIGIVFQKPTLLRWRRIIENILFPAELLRLDMSSARRRAHRLIEIAGLSGFENYYPHELSGGMQQRVAICRALLHDPPLLVMDEPFGALDALTRDEMGYELLKIWDQGRITCLFITHSITEAVFLSDRIVVMTPRPGRTMEVIKVPLSRPRRAHMKATGEFSELVERIGRCLGLGRGAE